MAVIKSPGPEAAVILLQDGQATADGNNTNTVDRGSRTGPAQVDITAGFVGDAGSTATVGLLVSPDGVYWSEPAYVQFSPDAPPSVGEPVVVRRGVPGATVLLPMGGWRYLKLRVSESHGVALVAVFHG